MFEGSMDGFEGSSSWDFMELEEEMDRIVGLEEEEGEEEYYESAKGGGGREGGGGGEEDSGEEEEDERLWEEGSGVSSKPVTS